MRKSLNVRLKIAKNQNARANQIVIHKQQRPVEHRVSIVNTAHHDYVNLLSRPAGGAP